MTEAGTSGQIGWAGARASGGGNAAASTSSSSLPQIFVVQVGGSQRPLKIHVPEAPPGPTSRLTFHRIPFMTTIIKHGGQVESISARSDVCVYHPDANNQSIRFLCKNVRDMARPVDIVHPDWAHESIKAGRLLDTKDPQWDCFTRCKINRQKPLGKSGAGIAKGTKYKANNGVKRTRFTEEDIAFIVRQLVDQPNMAPSGYKFAQELARLNDRHTAASYQTWVSDHSELLKQKVEAERRRMTVGAREQRQQLIAAAADKQPQKGRVLSFAGPARVLPDRPSDQAESSARPAEHITQATASAIESGRSEVRRRASSSAGPARAVSGRPSEQAKASARPAEQMTQSTALAIESDASEARRRASSSAGPSGVVSGRPSEQAEGSAQPAEQMTQSTMSDMGVPEVKVEDEDDDELLDELEKEEVDQRVQSVPSSGQRAAETGDRNLELSPSPPGEFELGDEADRLLLERERQRVAAIQAATSAEQPAGTSNQALDSARSAIASAVTAFAGQIGGQPTIRKWIPRSSSGISTSSTYASAIEEATQSSGPASTPAATQIGGTQAGDIPTQSSGLFSTPAATQIGGILAAENPTQSSGTFSTPAATQIGGTLAGEDPTQASGPSSSPADARNGDPAPVSTLRPLEAANGHANPSGPSSSAAKSSQVSSSHPSSGGPANLDWEQALAMGTQVARAYEEQVFAGASQVRVPSSEDESDEFTDDFTPPPQEKGREKGKGKMMSKASGTRPRASTPQALSNSGADMHSPDELQSSSRDETVPAPSTLERKRATKPTDTGSEIDIDELLEHQRQRIAKAAADSQLSSNGSQSSKKDKAISVSATLERNRSPEATDSGSEMGHDELGEDQRQRQVKGASAADTQPSSSGLQAASKDEAIPASGTFERKRSPEPTDSRSDMELDELQEDARREAEASAVADTPLSSNGLQSSSKNKAVTVSGTPERNRSPEATDSGSEMEYDESAKHQRQRQVKGTSAAGTQPSFNGLQAPGRDEAVPASGTLERKRSPEPTDSRSDMELDESQEDARREVEASAVADPQLSSNGPQSFSKNKAVSVSGTPERKRSPEPTDAGSQIEPDEPDELQEHQRKRPANATAAADTQLSPNGVQSSNKDKAVSVPTTLERKRSPEATDSGSEMEYDELAEEQRRRQAKRAKPTPRVLPAQKTAMYVDVSTSPPPPTAIRQDGPSTSTARFASVSTSPIRELMQRDERAGEIVQQPLARRATTSNSTSTSARQSSTSFSFGRDEARARVSSIRRSLSSRDIRAGAVGDASTDSQQRLRRKAEKSEIQARVCKLALDFGFAKTSQLRPYMPRDGDLDECRARLEQHFNEIAQHYDAEVFHVVQTLKDCHGDLDEALGELDEEAFVLRRAARRGRMVSMQTS
ncbi:hypothetical protein A4X13_0g1235 [Tilletia indica]|uniref:Uncharacterized protein n=1 Tax=Tilletia indica TaxID=43049 RepID=A0A177TXY1_9BASI|nr:hypothetical protein A4X13_0g1235 [Tilletia indica]